MSRHEQDLRRREFLKALVAVGLTPALARAIDAPASAPTKTGDDGLVPRRKLGKTGVEVSCLAMGAPMKPEVMDAGLRYGFFHWDTAASYSGVEPAIGNYFKQNKGARDKVFLSAKPADLQAKTLPVIAEVSRSLDNSLKVMNTDHIDMFFGVHAMTSPNQLTDDLRKFAEDAKKAGKIRLFGFSNHANTAENLMAASKLDWIDALFVAFNYRAVNNKKLNDAIDACVKAGIGLIAIKTQGFGVKKLSDEEAKVVAHFSEGGYDDAQAKIRVVLEDKRFTSASVGMKTVQIVDSCAGAALGKQKLSAVDLHVLQQHAGETCGHYCAGCANICGASLPELPLISDVMRFLMYSENYGERELAQSLFARLPAEARAKLLSADYTAAEAACPQRIAIAATIRGAFEILA